jgi:branched-chain amino acid transport system ATP-binding protein
VSDLLDVRDLHAFYGKSHVLHGVNLRVGRGEIVSLLGRNGVSWTPLDRSYLITNRFWVYPLFALRTKV